jgi:glycerate dehydrogenase
MTGDRGMRVVFLDRASLKANIRPLSFAAQYSEYDATDTSDILPRLTGAAVAIVNKVPLRRPVLELLPELKLIAVAATGVDNVDVAYCLQTGIAVANIRNYAVHTVPEHAFALILALRRNLFAYAQDVESGAWNLSPQFCLLTHSIADLHGATLGIVGAGAIGRATAAIGAAFGMRVLFAARGPAEGGPAEGGPADRGSAPGDTPSPPTDSLERVPLDELLRRSDVISLHCPLLPATRNLIGMDALRKMKRSALLINTARGGLVDESALLQALEQGLIAGAGFDVLTTEPPRHGNPLLDPHPYYARRPYARRPNLIVTPHIAWASDQAMQALADQLIDNIERWAAGSPQHLVR